MKLQSTSFKKMLVIRKGQSLANIGGQLSGWTDPKITIQGRHDAFDISEILTAHISSFDGFYSSDLRRCTEFADIVLNFNGINGRKLLTIDKRLREIKFGNDEGLCYDTMSNSEKSRIDSIEYQSANGESWTDVRNRFIQFAREQKRGPLIVFTHGGLICSFTYQLGLENVVRPGSILGILFDEESPEKSKIEFVWEHPVHNNL